MISLSTADKEKISAGAERRRRYRAVRKLRSELKLTEGAGCYETVFP